MCVVCVCLESLFKRVISLMYQGCQACSGQRIPQRVQCISGKTKPLENKLFTDYEKF